MKASLAVATLAFPVTLSACSGAYQTVPPIHAASKTPVSTALSVVSEASTKGHLFVVNGGAGTVTKYPPVSGWLKATFTKGIIDRPFEVALDSGANVYIASQGLISVYKPGKVSPQRKVTAGLEGVGSFALDANNWLYVSTDPQRINIYQAGSGAVWRTITGLQVAPISFAFDGAGDLYALQNLSTKMSSVSTITEYGPQGGSLIRTIKKGLNGTSAIALDRTGRLYALNRTVKSVSVYAAGAKKPSLTITTGITDPAAIAVDAKNNLYVANYSSNTVAVYKPGSKTPAFTISKGLHKPRALTFDHNNNLYVGNSLSVSVYGSVSSTPIAVVKKSAGVQGVLNLAFGP